MIEFKGAQFPRSIILHAVSFYVRYAVSYRDLEEILAERGVKVDHSTLNRWVVKLAPLIAAQAQARKRGSPRLPLRPGQTSTRIARGGSSRSRIGKVPDHLMPVTVPLLQADDAVRVAHCSRAALDQPSGRRRGA